MGTYYIKPNGISQKDLVNFLKDLETAFGGTNVNEYITIPTTVDVTGYYDLNSTISAGISASSGFSALISTQVLGGNMGAWVPYYTISLAGSSGGSGGSSIALSAAATYADSCSLSYVTSASTSLVTRYGTADSVVLSSATALVSATSSTVSLNYSLGNSISKSYVASHVSSSAH